MKKEVNKIPKRNSHSYNEHSRNSRAHAQLARAHTTHLHNRPHTHTHTHTHFEQGTDFDFDMTNSEVPSQIAARASSVKFSNRDFQFQFHTGAERYSVYSILVLILNDKDYCTGSTDVVQ